MGNIAKKSFDKPDESRQFEHGRADIVHLSKASAGRALFEPGWSWSKSLKPIVGGDSCQMHHVGYCLSGSIHIKTDDGEEFDISARDVYEIMPGHDAWVGDDGYEALEFQSKTVEDFAKKN